MDGDVAVDVVAVSKSFRSKNKRSPRRTVPAVRDCGLRVATGEVLGLLGPNGSGKSTLIRMIATLLLPDCGTIRVFGFDVARQTYAVRRLINRVSVEASFFKKLSATENLLFAAGIYGLPRAEASARMAAIVERIGLPAARLGAPMESFCRGMQQNVAIARAFLTSPVLLLLDEPTTGLDPRARREVQALVREVRDRQRATVLLSTHDMEEAEALCDRIAVIHDGRIVAIDTPQGLKRSGAGEGAESVGMEEVFLALTGTTMEASEVAAEEQE